jgi:hypothetical protein
LYPIDAILAKPSAKLVAKKYSVLGLTSNSPVLLSNAHRVAALYISGMLSPPVYASP